MKKAILLMILLISSWIGFTQTLENLDFISPVHDDMAAVERDGQWGFINANGDLVIDFRNDLVPSKNKAGNYPVFSDDRALIKQKKEGIVYYGYIDSSGKTIIDPEYLNATPFVEGEAIVLKLVKETLGSNDALGKNVINYKYFEVVIDVNNEVLDYLIPEGVNIVIDKDYMKAKPVITSKRVARKLYAVKGMHNSWNIVKLR